MGAIVRGIASLFGVKPRMSNVEDQPAATYAPPPEAEGKTLSDNEIDRIKNAIQKRQLGAKALQIPLVGANTTINTPSTGINTGGNK